MKILILLAGANHPMYQNCERVLKNIYRRTIEEYNLPMTVLSYSGRGNDSIADIRLNCPDDNQFEKHFHLLSWLAAYPEYEVVIKTNVSTVLNLKLLNEFIHSDAFDTHRVYGSSLMWDKRYCGENYGMFLVGYFLMGHHNIWVDAFGVYDRVFKDTMTNDVLNILTHGKMDINDDMLLGPVCARTGHMPARLNGLTIASNKVEFWGERNLDNIASAVCVRCKMALPSGSPEARNIFEPTILELIGEFYRILPLEQQYIKNLKESIYYTDWKIPGK